MKSNARVCQISFLIRTNSGRVCRSGQLKPTEFRVLWVQGDAHDEAPRLSNTTRMSEAEALTQLDKTRLQRKNTADDERMDEEE